MNRVAPAVLASAILSGLFAPAAAQSDGTPVENALVLVAGHDDSSLTELIGSGGSPYNVKRMLEAAEELLSANPYHGATNDVGKFSIEAPLNPGTYNASVFVPGFVASSGPATIAVDSDAGHNNVTIFVQPSAIVSGRVTDDKGRAISGIVVSVGSRHSTNYDITMDDGVFVLDTGLKTGSYEIHAFKSGIGNVSGLQKELDLNLPLESKVPSFFKTEPAGFVSHVSNVTLEQGKLTTLNIQLQGSHSIQGRVTDEAGSPVGGVAVFAFDEEGDMANTMSITDADGRYRLENDLASGTYKLVIPSVFGKGYAPASSSVRVPATADVEIKLQNSLVIGGKVTDANGKAVENATVFAIEKSSVGTDRLDQFLAAGMAEASTDELGGFRLDRSIGNGTFVVAASFGDLPVTNSIESAAGNSSTLIRLDFTDILTIKGKVTDPSGESVKDALVIPSFASAIASAEDLGTTTGPDGTFVLTAPIKQAATKSLFGELVVVAEGYATETAQVENSSLEIALEKKQPSVITGMVIAQKSLSPPVEIALEREGTILFDHEGSLYQVGLHTNSRVLDALFDQSGKRVGIQLEGVQGSSGMSELAIPKDFLGGPFAVSLDGKIAEAEKVRTSENQTHSIISVAHEHDLQELVIQGSTAVPEFPLPAVLAAIGVAAVLLSRRFRIN